MGSCFSTGSSAKQGTSAFVHGVGSRDKQAWACIYSEDEQKCVPCKLTVVNACAESLTLCWVDTSGKLVHYVPIHPLGSIKDGSVVNKSTQHTRSGHVFVVYASGSAQSKPVHLGDVNEGDFRMLYRPSTMNAEEEHVITVEDCGACSLEVRKKSERALIDNTTKEYSPSSDYDDCDYEGFRLLCDAHVTAESVKVLVADLKEVERLLPSHALKLLQMDTPFYVNSSLEYGYRDEPTKGLHATFHPQGSASWLRDHGLSTTHEGSIELMNVDHYCRDRACWGPGGLLLHELCHAYHNKHLQGGYNNEEVQRLYDAAMNANLYDHCTARYKDGTYSEPMRGYCAADCMEFFAELSVAFLWREDDTTEFNKWSPRNGSQLKALDRKTYDGLAAVWSAGQGERQEE